MKTEHTLILIFSEAEYKALISESHTSLLLFTLKMYTKYAKYSLRNNSFEYYEWILQRIFQKSKNQVRDIILFFLYFSWKINLSFSLSLSERNVCVDGISERKIVAGVLLQN